MNTIVHITAGCFHCALVSLLRKEAIKCGPDEYPRIAFDVMQAMSDFIHNTSKEEDKDKVVKLLVEVLIADLKELPRSAVTLTEFKWVVSPEHHLEPETKQ